MDGITSFELIGNIESEEFWGVIEDLKEEERKVGSYTDYGENLRTKRYRLLMRRSEKMNKREESELECISDPIVIHNGISEFAEVLYHMGELHADAYRIVGEDNFGYFNRHYQFYRIKEKEGLINRIKAFSQ